MIDRYLQRHVKLIHTGASPQPLITEFRCYQHGVIPLYEACRCHSKAVGAVELSS